MEQRTLEIVLKYYRKKYGLSQEEICSGICSPATLSRLEKGNREMDSLTGELLAGRIGKEITDFELLLDEEDYKLWMLRSKIKKSVEKCEYTDAERKIEEYRSIMPKQEAIHEQFCLYQESIIMIKQEEFGDVLGDTLRKAILISIPDFEERKDRQQLFNPMEIQLILNYIRYDVSAHKNMEENLLRLLDHINKYYSERKKEETGTEIYLELIRQQLNQKKYQKASIYIDEAINLIGQGKGFFHLAKLHFEKAQCIWHLYREDEDWEFYKKKCVEECKIAYYVFEIEEKMDCMQEVKRFCEEKVGWQFTTQEM